MLQPAVSMNTFWYDTTDADLKEKIISNHSMSPKAIDCREGDCKRITLISDSTLFSIQHFSPTKYKKIVQHNFLEINWREWRLHQEKILPSWGKWLCLAVYFGQTNTNTNTQGTCGHISLTGGWLSGSHFSETTNFEFFYIYNDVEFGEIGFIQ